MEQESKGNKALIWVVVAVLVVAVGAFLFFANVEEEDDPVEEQDTEQVVDDEEAPVEPTENIVELAAADPNLSILVDAVQAADLVEDLSAEGPFTVFAPTDAAFEAAAADLGITVEELLESEDLANILNYHVLAGEFLAADVTGLDGEEIATAQGQTVSVAVTDETVQINDALVTAADIQATNGVIHVIDAVLLPEEE